MAATAVTADLVIHNGTLVSHDGMTAASIAIRDGRVLAVGAREAMPPARETFDASGLHILPGAIDVHVHFRDPGYPHKEDWETGTAAAAFGGVTTVFDMPNTIPPTGDAETLAAKHAIAAKKACVDFGLYGLLGEDTIENVPELIDGGVIGFKLYMGNTFGKIPSPSTGAMLEAFEVVAPTGKRISLHAETNSIMERRQERLTRAGRRDPLAHIELAAGSGRDRSRQPRGIARGVDWRTDSHPAHFIGRRVAAATRRQGARCRYHRRNLPALSAPLHRRLPRSRRDHSRQSAGARSPQPRTAVGGAFGRHHRSDRDRPRPAHAGRKDAQ